MFFKRRSRANSYIDNDAPARSQSYDDNNIRPDSSSNQNQNQGRTQSVASPTDEKDQMYPRQSAPQDAYAAAAMQNGHNAMPAMGNPTPPLNSGKPEPMPDLLAQAFNQAVRPYTEKIDQLQSRIQDMQAWVEQLEQQRAEVHSWIDKRGLRPGMISSHLSFELYK